MKQLPTLHTERLVLRPWQVDDIDALHALWTSADVRRYLWDDVVIPHEVAADVVASHFVTAERHGFGYWSIYRRAVANELAGFCGFRFIQDSNDVEILYGLRSDLWAQGFATEACSAALDSFWAETDFERVYARTDPPNTPSVAVMKRLGMTHEATTETTVTYSISRP